MFHGVYKLIAIDYNFVRLEFKGDAIKTYCDLWVVYGIFRSDNNTLLGELDLFTCNFKSQSTDSIEFGGDSLSRTKRVTSVFWIIN